MPPARPVLSGGDGIVIFASTSMLPGGATALGIGASMPDPTVGDGIGIVPPPDTGITRLDGSTVTVLGVLGGPRSASMEGVVPAGVGGMGMVAPSGDS
ncbi:hypothetical protein BJV77DRAFT_1030163 [Russula vinacea]|nr:hypothetical protein BJV77DRAFT_1030163 [Russula vinacea]